MQTMFAVRKNIFIFFLQEYVLNVNVQQSVGCEHNVLLHMLHVRSYVFVSRIAPQYYTYSQDR